MTIRESFCCALESVDTTIASGASLSSALDLGGLRLFGIVMPSAWTSADITFQSSHDGGTTWNNMYDADGNEITATVSASRSVVMLPEAFAAVPMIKVRSGPSATPVNQTDVRTIKLILRSY